MGLNSCRGADTGHGQYLPEALHGFRCSPTRCRGGFEAVAEAVEPVEARKGAIIVERSGSDDGYTYFLSEGEVSPEAADGVTTTVDSSPETLRTPVANLRPRIPV